MPTKAVDNGARSGAGIMKAMQDVGTLKCGGLTGDYKYGTAADRVPPKTSTVFEVNPSSPGGLKAVKTNFSSPTAQRRDSIAQARAFVSEVMGTVHDNISVARDRAYAILSSTQLGKAQELEAKIERSVAADNERAERGGGRSGAHRGGQCEQRGLRYALQQAPGVGIRWLDAGPVGEASKGFVHRATSTVTATVYPCQRPPRAAPAWDA